MEIKITKELAERILSYLKNHNDAGDYREEWQSNQLVKDIEELKKALNGNSGK